MKRLFAIILAVMMIVSLAACGEKSETSTDSSTTSSSSSSSSSNIASSKKYATLQDYMDDPVNLNGVDAIKEAGAGTLDIDVRAEGNVLVYDYTYLTTIDASVLPSVKTTLEQTLDTSESTFVTLADTMQNSIDERIQIKVIYRNGDKEIITERTFDPS